MYKKILFWIFLFSMFNACVLREQNNNELEDINTLDENNYEVEVEKEDTTVVENYEEKVFYVDHYINSAFGFHEGLSYRVKENLEDEWESLYVGIEGFEYELGYVYRIRVRKYQVENPPADGASIRYEFAELLSKDVNNADFTITIKRDIYSWIDHSDEGLALLWYCTIIATDELKEELLEKLEDENITKIDGLFRHSDEYRTIELVSIEVE